MSRSKLIPSKNLMLGALSWKPFKQALLKAFRHPKAAAGKPRALQPQRTLLRKMLLANTSNLNERLITAQAISCVRHDRTAGLLNSRSSPSGIYEKGELQNGDIIVRIDAKAADVRRIGALGI